jgi:hypothetical protein
MILKGVNSGFSLVFTLVAVLGTSVVLALMFGFAYLAEKKLNRGPVTFSPAGGDARARNGEPEGS